jgi:MFS family permease
VIFATILLDFMGFSILIPVLPVVLQDMGADAIDIGVILALYVIAMVVFLPFWGWISDRVGRRPVLLACLLGTAASFALMAVATNLTVFYWARILAGFFGASVGTAQAYIIDITSEEERAKGIGLIGAASAGGVIFGPAVGGALLGVDPALPFYLPVVLALLAFAGAALFLPESRAPQPEPTGLRGLAKTLIPTPLVFLFSSDGNRTRLYLYLFLHIFASFAVLEGMFPLYAEKRFEWQGWEIGLFISGVAIVVGLTQLLLVPRLASLFGEGSISIVGLAMAGVGLLGLGQAQSANLMMLSASAVAVGNGLWFPTFTSSFSKTCGGPNDQGETMARSVAMAQTGRGLGIIFGGLAQQRMGVGWEFTLAGVGLFAALIILVAGLPLLLPKR